MGEEGRPSSGRRSNKASGPVAVVWREREEVSHEKWGSPVLLRLEDVVQPHGCSSSSTSSSSRSQLSFRFCSVPTKCCIKIQKMLDYNVTGRGGIEFELHVFFPASTNLCRCYCPFLRTKEILPSAQMCVY